MKKGEYKLTFKLQGERERTASFSSAFEAKRNFIGLCKLCRIESVVLRDSSMKQFASFINYGMIRDRLKELRTDNDFYKNPRRYEKTSEKKNL